MQGNDDLIRRRAHQIWEEQGRPDGQDQSHWDQARTEIEGLAEAGDSDFAADDRRREKEATPEAPPLPTTRQAAAFHLATTKSDDA